MNDTELYVLRQIIATNLDKPSVYATGPTLNSINKAIDIIEDIMIEFTISPKEEYVNSIKSWRTSSWKSLDRI